MEYGPATLVETAVGDDTAMVVVRGEIDVATVDDLVESLAKALARRPSRLVIDLGDTAFIDLAGMEAIAQAHRDAPPGCQIVLRSPNGLARRVIELTGMDQICLVD